MRKHHGKRQRGEQGIDAIDGQHFCIGDTDEELAAQAIGLLREQRKARMLGTAARRYVTENVSWQSALAGLPDLVGWPVRAARDAA